MPHLLELFRLAPWQSIWSALRWNHYRRHDQAHHRRCDLFHRPDAEAVGIVVPWRLHHDQPHMTQIVGNRPNRGRLRQREVCGEVFFQR